MSKSDRGRDAGMTGGLRSESKDSSLVLQVDPFQAIS